MFHLPVETECILECRCGAFHCVKSDNNAQQFGEALGKDLLGLRMFVVVVQLGGTGTKLLKQARNNLQMGIVEGVRRV